MNDVLVITPPDKIFNQNNSILLIHPSDSTRESVETSLADVVNPYNVYLYTDNNEQDVDWLLSIAKFADLVIFDIDNCNSTTACLASYLVSLPRTYWITQYESVYSYLSPNRIWDTDSIQHLLGERN